MAGHSATAAERTAATAEAGAATAEGTAEGTADFAATAEGLPDVAATAAGLADCRAAQCWVAEACRPLRFGLLSGHVGLLSVNIGLLSVNIGLSVNVGLLSINRYGVSASFSAYQHCARNRGSLRSSLTTKFRSLTNETKWAITSNTLLHFFLSPSPNLFRPH